MPRARKYDEDVIEKVLALKQQGYSVSKISELLGIPRSSVYYIVKNHEEQTVSNEAKGSKGLEELSEEDKKLMMRFRSLKMDKKIPILYEELKTQAWWHKLVHSVGVNTVLLALASADIADEELADKIKEWKKDPSKLEEYVLEFLGKMVEVRKDAARVMELEQDLRVSEALVKFYKKLAFMCKDAYDTLVMMLPNSLRMKFYFILLLKYMLGGVSLVPGQLSSFSSSNKTGTGA